jgi:5,5'-dehydrodivanillate O-demethylase
MLTKEQNERLTKVGPGTPGGELLRRYWQPLCPAAELTDKKPRKRIRILGEDVVVFRMADGSYSCIEEFCKHRRASLYYGFLEEDGIRCCYHGWKYDFSGQCVDQPFQPAESRMKDSVRIKAYPVRKLGGILFTYMGPDATKAPLLPRWDVLVREDGNRVIQVLPVHHCNWLQVQENTADSVHTYYLHGRMNQVHNLGLEGAEYYLRPIAIEQCDWSVCEWGIDKKIVYAGDKPEVEIRPPLIFPNVLRIPQGPVECMHWRVPIDDTSTRIIWIGLIPQAAGGKPMKEDVDPPFEYLEEPMGPDGDYRVDSFYFQDQMVMEMQGPVYDRSKETLAISDRGIVMFRNMLSEQIDIVEKGGEPTVAVVRDPAKNRMIEFANATSPGGSVELSFVR